MAIPSRHPARRPAGLALVVVCAGGVLAGCDSTGATAPSATSSASVASSGTSAPAPSGSAASGSASSGTAASGTAAPATTAAELAERVTAAQRSATYFHVQQKITDEGSTPVDVDVHLTGSGRDLNLMAGESGMRAIGADYYLYGRDATDGRPWMYVAGSDHSCGAVNDAS